MKRTYVKCRGLSVFLSIALLVLSAAGAGGQADIPGIPGPVFALTASAFHIDTPDGDSLLVWGYGVTGATGQYPGPTPTVAPGGRGGVSVHRTPRRDVPVSQRHPARPPDRDVAPVGDHRPGVRVRPGVE